MNPNDVIPEVPYKDRRNGLMIVGILQIVMGAGAWLLALLTGVTVQMAARQGMSAASMLPGLLFYTGAGAVFIGLGVGTVRGRRWARAIWLVVSTGWLVFGVIGLGGMVYWIPRVFEALGTMGPNQPPPGVFTIMLVVMLGFGTVFLLVVPLVFVLFFRSPHVKATCEAINPAPSWSDSRPLPVLAAALWVSFLGLSMLAMPFMYGGLYPVFGAFVRGGVGWALWGGTITACAVCALGLFRGRVWACDGALVLVLAFSASSILTYWKADMKELYVSMGMLDAQIQLIEKMGLMSSGYMASTSVCFLCPYILLLAWARYKISRDDNRMVG